MYENTSLYITRAIINLIIRGVAVQHFSASNCVIHSSLHQSHSTHPSVLDSHSATRQGVKRQIIQFGKKIETTNLIDIRDSTTQGRSRRHQLTHMTASQNHVNNSIFSLIPHNTGHTTCSRHSPYIHTCSRLILIGVITRRC